MNTEDNDEVSVYAVMSDFCCLQPKEDALIKVQSGGDKVGWINARYNVWKQVKAMLGNLIQDKMMTYIEGKNIYK